VVFSYALVNYSVLGSKEERRQMSQNVTNELIYDVLKQLQADVAEVKGPLRITRDNSFVCVKI
jgi:hypothetical protein